MSLTQKTTTESIGGGAFCSKSVAASVFGHTTHIKFSAFDT